MGDRFTTFDDLHVGQKATFTKTIGEEELAHFIAITEDRNPLHVDEEFAAGTFFGSRIAHGMLSASLFSTLVGMELPGTGAIYRSQTLEFLRPCHLGDTLTAVFVVHSIDRAKNRIVLDSWIENQKGERVIEGRAVASLIRAG
ncbi:MAG: MaoC family dehydratase [Thermoanaerobaculia bacterium]|nr:MaoC family dehydratase [Thermoanaerobaculia bacterium]